MSLELEPIQFGPACGFIDANHRHRRAPTGHRFSLACLDAGRLCAVMTVGNANGFGFKPADFVLEVTRVASDGTPNACSILYGAAARARRALYYRRIVTYTLASECGASLRAAGWVITGKVRAQSWDRPSRARIDRYPIVEKLRWEPAK